MYTWDDLEAIRQEIPPRQSGDDCFRSQWGKANDRFECALKQYEREHAVSWFARLDWDYNFHREKV